MAYYLIQQDIYDLWNNLSEYSWLDVYDVLEYERELLEMDEPFARLARLNPIVRRVSN